jgi:apolipoprotein N-acyltransferase
LGRLAAPLRWLCRFSRQPYGQVWWSGFVFWMLALHWLRLPHWATSIGWVALSFYLAFYILAFVWLTRVAMSKLHVPLVVAAPPVWTGLELVRGHLLGGFTMGSLGHTQYQWLTIIQLCDLVGAYGVSFLVMMGAAATADAIPLPGQRPRWRPLGVFALVLAGVLVYGNHRLGAINSAAGAPPDSPSSLKVALIQGTFDTTFEYDPTRNQRVYDRYLAISKEAKRRHHDVALVVWPESMFGYQLETRDEQPLTPEGYEFNFEAFEKTATQRQELLANIARSLDCDALVGANVRHWGDEGTESFNAALHITRQGRLAARYDKMNAVMFGEYVPLGDVFPWLYALTPLSHGMSEGQRPQLVTVQHIGLAPSICYETILPHVICGHVRELAAVGRQPDALVNLTNDGWFWGSSELDLHLMCGVFRAVECRKPLLIAANTGISAWIDETGRIVEQAPRRRDTFVIAHVRPNQRFSPYVAWGDWFSALCLAGCVVLSIAGLWPARASGSTSPPR